MGMGRSLLVWFIITCCIMIIGVSNQAEKDEIVKSVMGLRNAEVEEGCTLDAVVSRQDLLMDVRDKLLFEPEYVGNVREKVPPKSSLRIPWSWVPAALCLLQEAGEENLVLEIGRAALQHPDANPFTHDCLLSMALAEKCGSQGDGRFILFSDVAVLWLPSGGGGFGRSSHEPKYKIEFHEPHSPFHPESMVMSDKNGQKFSCFLPKEDKTKTSKFVTQQNTSSLIVETQIINLISRTLTD